MFFARPIPEAAQLRGLALLVTAVLLFAGCGGEPRAVAPLPQDVYVWQRVWTEPVVEAVSSEGPSFSRVLLLAAEVKWSGDTPEVSRPALPLGDLATIPGEFAPTLRLGPYSGAFSRDDETAIFLSKLAREIVAEWKDAEIEAAEFQVDFDAATARLDDYRLWVEMLREAVAPIPLTITALPTWLPHRAFKRLARVTDGYVLQVHSFRRPPHIGGIDPLCDPEQARRAVSRAGRIGVPFRVALPTYAYALQFDEDGQFLRIVAEGASRTSFSPGTQTRLLSAQPEEIASLLRSWDQRRPRALEGIAWFRLPTLQDQWNWPIETLRAVREGRVPEHRIDLRAEDDGTGLIRILLENMGETDSSPPRWVATGLNPSELMVGDGLNGFAWEDSDDTELRLYRQRPMPPLRPGDSLPIAWLRTSSTVTPTLMKNE